MKKYLTGVLRVDDLVVQLEALAESLHAADGAADLAGEAVGTGLVADQVARLVEVADGVLAEDGVPLAADRVEAQVVAPEMGQLSKRRLYRPSVAGSKLRGRRK